MTATTGVSVDEYLTSVYEPDCDYEAFETPKTQEILPIIVDQRNRR